MSTYFSISASNVTFTESYNYGIVKAGDAGSGARGRDGVGGSDTSNNSPPGNGTSGGNAGTAGGAGTAYIYGTTATVDRFTIKIDFTNGSTGTDGSRGNNGFGGLNLFRYENSWTNYNAGAIEIENWGPKRVLEQSAYLNGSSRYNVNLNGLVTRIGLVYEVTGNRTTSWYGNEVRIELEGAEEYKTSHDLWNNDCFYHVNHSTFTADRGGIWLHKNRGGNWYYCYIINGLRVLASNESLTNADAVYH